MNELTPVITLFIGVLVGIVIAALFTTSKRSGDEDEALSHALAAEQFAWLDESECNLMFNPHLKLWAVLDGNNKPIGAGTTPREAIQKARINELVAVA